jgi:hypothetical protein
VQLCPRDEGTYRLRVQLRGGDGVVASQLFIDRAEEIQASDTLVVAR